MANIVTISDIQLINNPARFSDLYRFKVTFESMAPLKDDIDWKLLYVSSSGKDHEIADFAIGPVPLGVTPFEFEGSAPYPSEIPPEDVLDISSLVLTVSYKEQEFIRVEYYQATEYDNEEMREKPPTNIMFERLRRDISAKTRLTRSEIKWDVTPT